MESTRLTLHVAVSNQSRAGDADIVVRLDGRVVCTTSLRAGGQHHWQESATGLQPGRHALEVEESKTATTARESFDADGDRWIVVMFEGPPPRLAVHVLDREVGLL